MAGFVKVTTLDELPVGSIRSFEIDCARFVLARTDEGVFALATTPPPSRAAGSGGMKSCARATAPVSICAPGPSPPLRLWRRLRPTKSKLKAKMCSFGLTESEETSYVTRVV